MCPYCADYSYVPRDVLIPVKLGLWVPCRFCDQKGGSNESNLRPV